MSSVTCRKCRKSFRLVDFLVLHNCNFHEKEDHNYASYATGGNVAGHLGQNLGGPLGQNIAVPPPQNLGGPLGQPWRLVLPLFARRPVGWGGVGGSSLV